MRFVPLVATTLLLLLAGCGTKPIDYPLAAQQSNVDRRSVDVEPDRPLLLLAFSGGGSRAAALAAAVTARLDAITYNSAAGPRHLSQDVAVVSSVSGGSVYSAYIGLHGAGGDAARAFEQRISNYDGMGYLFSRALDPFTWIGLQFEDETRIAVLQQMVGDILQTQATLRELNAPGKPLILMNASDMVAGQVFTFDPETLDDLCMDYDSVPVSLAATSSAAFPFAFTPILLKNDSYPHCQGTQMPPGDWQTALTVPSGRYANLPSFRDARYRESLRAAPDAFRQPEYVRLVDGGVVDNLGLTAIRRVLFTPGSPVDLTGLINRGKLRRLVVISVNARSDARDPLDSSPKYTGLVTMAGAVSGVLVDSAAAGSATAFDAFVTNLAEDRNSLLRQGVKQAAFDIYPIAIDFDQLPNATAAETQELNAVKSIATSWSLANGDMALLDKVAGELLWRHPCFRKLVTDLGAQATAEAPAVPDTVCPVPPMPAR